MSREQGMELVKEYDHREPSSLESYCDFLNIKKEHFYELVEDQKRLNDLANSTGLWEPKDAVWLKKMDNEEVSYSRVAKSNDETFSELNRHLYYNYKST